MESYSGHFEMVDPRLVVIDHRYQRPEKPALIAAIATDPRWELFGVPVLFKRGSTFYCGDGQQRIAGVKASSQPPKTIPAVWFPMNHLEDEAAVFVQINEFRTQLSALEKHKGKIVAKDPATLAVERVVETAGLSIGGHNNNPESRTISAISTLYGVYNQLGEDGLLQTLVICRDAFPDDAGAFSSLILQVVSEVIAEQGAKYERQKLSAALGKLSVPRILRKSEELRFEMGGSRRVNMRRALKVLAKV